MYGRDMTQSHGEWGRGGDLVGLSLVGWVMRIRKLKRVRSPASSRPETKSESNRPHTKKKE
jgi:hypothetical protein